jgi:hypothetical protein
MEDQSLGSDEKKQADLLVDKLRVVGGVLFGLVVISVVLVLLNPVNVLGNLFFLLQFIDVFNGANLFLLAQRNGVFFNSEHAKSTQGSLLAATFFGSVVLAARVYSVYRAAAASPGTALRESIVFAFSAAVVAVLVVLVNITATVFTGETRQFAARVALK